MQTQGAWSKEIRLEEAAKEEDESPLLLWNITLTRQRCVTSIYAAFNYVKLFMLHLFNDVNICSICSCCICLLTNRCVAVSPYLHKAPDWSNKKLNDQ